MLERDRGFFGCLLISNLLPYQYIEWFIFSLREKVFISLSEASVIIVFQHVRALIRQYLQSLGISSYWIENVLAEDGSTQSSLLNGPPDFT